MICIWCYCESYYEIMAYTFFLYIAPWSVKQLIKYLLCRLLHSLRNILGVLTNLSWQETRYTWIFNIWRYWGCHNKIVDSVFVNFIFSFCWSIDLHVTSVICCKFSVSAILLSLNHIMLNTTYCYSYLHCNFYISYYFYVEMFHYLS
jgi:hypothetical protein